ncbi:MAG: hypothetical protein NC112_07145 [Oxalobacter formigenes]|nr:hypothetical protein [Oxalobacter formigenes]
MSDSTSDCSVEYHRLRDELLCDIGKDTDKILAKMEKGTNMDMSAFIAGQAAANNNRGNFGNDAALMLANQNGMGNMWNNPFMYLIWLAMFGYGNNGFGGRGMPPCGNPEANAMLLQAINQGSNTAQRDIDRLASAVGCGQGEIRNGLQVLNTSLCQIAQTLGMSVPQIINAIQAGNAGIIAKMQECCCENRLALCQQNQLIQAEGNATRALMTNQNYEAQLRQLAKENEELRTSAQTSVLLNRLDNNNNAVAVALTGITTQLNALAAAIARIPTTTTTTPATA